MTSSIEVEKILASHATRRVVAGLLRGAVTEFNAAPVTIAAVDQLREHVLRAADMLDVRDDEHSLRVV